MHTGTPLFLLVSFLGWSPAGTILNSPPPPHRRLCVYSTEMTVLYLSIGHAHFSGSICPKLAPIQGPRPWNQPPCTHVLNTEGPSSDATSLPKPPDTLSALGPIPPSALVSRLRLCIGREHSTKVLGLKGELEGGRASAPGMPVALADLRHPEHLGTQGLQHSSWVAAEVAPASPPSLSSSSQHPRPCC